MIFLDTSALLMRYVKEDGTRLVLDRMEEDQEWAASALAHAETGITLCHLGLEERVASVQRRRLRSDWEHFVVVPVDGSCLSRAAEIGCQHRVRTLDAIHLAAAERLPGRPALLTFDRRQADAGDAIGLRILTT